ncbi:MAG TPA: inositol monophosphatase family protein [Anaeromyxobacteraceae bacterium]|nr:inositol monophosphatase family protein [Anaeromyxobacteraceae bacterium]
MSEIGDLMEAVEEAARRGGAVLRDRFDKPRTIDYKGGIDLVTDADRASEEALLRFISERFPGSAVLAEESGSTGGEGGLRWYVDPLDGTTNYAHGVPHFAVNVALADGSGLAAGATLDPLRNELYLAGRGQGAFLSGKPIRVSEAAELRHALLCTGFPYDIHQDPEPVLSLFRAYLGRARAVRRFGAAALDLAYVAAGRFDGFWEAKLKPWDVAPGILLVTEAGGRVADFAGGAEMLFGGTICAANPLLQPLLLQVLAEVRASRGR